MTGSSEFLVRHGLPLMFGAVFLEQLGLPIPSLPWMLGAGALAATGEFSIASAIGAAALASVLADFIWFHIGRRRGVQVLGLLCRISIEPDSCVRKTQNLFSRHGVRALLVAKFIPGLNTLAPPLAGMSGIKQGTFLLADGAGAIIYAACGVVAGFLFKHQIEIILAAVSRVGGSALWLLGTLAVVYIAFKYWQRQKILRELRVARITAKELRERQEAGDVLAIFDLRSNEELESDPLLILGAVHVAPDALGERHGEIPRDREIIVYCSCPNEVTAAKVAMRLHRRGITRVRPLQGGIAAWREQKYPLEPRKELGMTA